MRQRCWQSVFFCLWKGFWEYQELLICCIPSSLQWLVCALRPAGEAFYFCGGYSEIKGPIYLQFLCYCRTGFFTFEENYNLGAAALKARISAQVTLCNNKFEEQRASADKAIGYFRPLNNRKVVGRVVCKSYRYKMSDLFWPIFCLKEKWSTAGIHQRSNALRSREEENTDSCFCR